MKTKLSWFDRIMAAVTFAEANEKITAKDFLTPGGRKPDREKKSTNCDAVPTTGLHGAEVHS